MDVCAFSLRYPAYKEHVPYYVVICDLSGLTTYFHIFSQAERFSKKQSYET
jgi:hypothetical protein